MKNQAGSRDGCGLPAELPFGRELSDSAGPNLGKDRWRERARILIAPFEAALIAPRLVRKTCGRWDYWERVPRRGETPGGLGRIFFALRKCGRWILLSRRELDWADRFFVRWGYLAVFIARLLPVIRTFIALPAGVARMPRGRFHVYTFLGSWPWCLGLAWLGMKLGENWRELGKYFHQFDAVIGAILAAGLVYFIWTHWQNRIRAAE
jgi:hypothetical protein